MNALPEKDFVTWEGFFVSLKKETKTPFNFLSITGKSLLQRELYKDIPSYIAYNDNICYTLFTIEEQ